MENLSKQAKIELLEQNSFVFEEDLTLDEIEWTRILGPRGLGCRLLDEMVALGGEFFELGAPSHTQNQTAETFCFEFEGQEHQVRLDYEQPFTSNLQSAVRQVLDGVNNVLRRQSVPFRFVCVRDTCTGAGCTYRLMMLPTAWIGEVDEELNIVAGLRLEDYEAQRPLGQRTGDQRPEAGGGFLEMR